MKKQDVSLHAELSARLKRHRASVGLTIEALAERIDTTPRYLQDVERGRVGMSLTTLKRLCEVLQISADALLFGAPAGIDALLREFDADQIDSIRELVRLQLKIMQK